MGEGENFRSGERRTAEKGKGELTRKREGGGIIKYKHFHPSQWQGCQGGAENNRRAEGYQGRKSGDRKDIITGLIH